MKKSSYSKETVFHWNLIKGAKYVGKYDMPELKAVHNLFPRNLTPFNISLKANNKNIKWFHFYIDDYRFERIWNNFDNYINLLKKYEGGISPDFSLYLNMPKAQQIWNCWRNRCLAYALQYNGINIIPNVSWSDEESLSWVFDGIPLNSVLSITTQGCMQDYYVKNTLLNGLHELVRIKKPEKLIVYGKFPEEWKKRFPMPIETFKSFSEERWG